VGVYATVGPSTVVALGPTAGGEDLSPFLTSDGLTLMFSSSRSGAHHLYISDRTGHEEVSTAVLIDSLASIQLAQDGPILSSDGLMLYFAVKAPNQRSVWQARRSGRSDTDFTDAHEVPELVANGTTHPAAISADGCRLMLTTNRVSATFDIWEARKPPR
jgi:Tol biopolymer transport system component